MKRIFISITVASALLIGSNVNASAAPLVIEATATPPAVHHELVGSAATGRWRGFFCQGWRLGENLTQAIWRRDPERGKRMMQRLIACVFARLAPGQSVTALMIADRESSFWPWAQNPGSLKCSGLFQHILEAWPGRRAAYVWKGWFGRGVRPVSVFDPRANAIATAEMVGPEGDWSDWSM
jgi:hypothetical protein